MEGAYTDKYSFIGEWYDNESSLVRQYYVFYYPTDDTLEMYDIRNRKTFVRRGKVAGITLDNFYIGCTLYIFGRLIKVTDFGCEHTRKRLSTDLQVTFAMLKPLPSQTAGKIITHLYQHGLKPTRMKKAYLTADDVGAIYGSRTAEPMYPFILEHLANQLVIGIELLGKNAVEAIKTVIGNTDPQKAEPGTIRALYGSDPVRNCVHVPTTVEEALKDLEYFFPPPPARAMRLRLTATLSNCTLCLIKPHAVREGKIGKAMEIIGDGGFDITAMNMLIVESVNAAEFYEVYKGIVPEFQGMIEELASGPCLALEIVCKDKQLNSAVEFRKLAGPVDPEVARLLRPHTLRAQLGNTKLQNAIHCSDLPEDGLLEVEYFFKILDL